MKIRRIRNQFPMVHEIVAVSMRAPPPCGDDDDDGRR